MLAVEVGLFWMQWFGGGPAVAFLQSSCEGECAAGPCASIGGQIVVDDGPCDFAVWVRLYNHRVKDGKPVPLAKEDIDVGFGLATVQWTVATKAKMTSATLFTYEMRAPAGNYSLMAFRDPWDNGTLPLSHQLGLGWHTGPDCVGGPYKICTVIVKARCDSYIDRADITLKAPQPFPKFGSDPTRHGNLRILQNQRVLYLRGNASQRGFAHGFLLARQIIDFFVFFLLEDRVQSLDVYSSQVFPKLRPGTATFQYSREFKQAADGILRGMRSSGISMFIQDLGRNFELEDLYAINAYGDLDVLIDSPDTMAGGSCTQFVFFGDETVGTDRNGGTVAGRNMDGEVDFRRLTVSHLLIFAIEPAGGRKFISIMWPGFVGTLTGFNEDGLYIMENFGCPPPRVSALGHGLKLNVDLVASILQTGEIGQFPTQQSVEDVMSRHASPDGGPCSHAATLFFAHPHPRNASSLPGGFAYECDRYGGKLRLPSDADVRPVSPTNIFGANHFFRYKTDPLDFQDDAVDFNCNGARPTFYSLWRYAAAQNMIEAWERSREPIGSARVKELLRLVSKGITEHSVIWKPEQRVFELAVPQLDSVWWDGSYAAWKPFEFAAVFQQAFEEAVLFK